MNRQLFKAALLVIFCLAQLTGCWSRKEINRLSIIMAAAIDPATKPDQIVYTIQIVNPAAGEKNAANTGQTGQTFYTAASSGFTLADAERHLYKQVPRPLFWQHKRALIINQKLARTKMTAIVDYFGRIAAFRHNMLLLITPGPAREALVTQSPAEKFSGQAIYDLVKESVKHSESYYPSDIKDFLFAASTPGIEPVLARLSIPTAGNDHSRSTTMELSGSAVFKGLKMVGWLDNTETRGLMWVQGKAQNLMLVIQYPGSVNLEQLLTIYNQKNTCAIRPKIAAGQLQVTLDITAKGRTSGASFVERDFTTPLIIKALNRQYALAIKREIRRALAKAQAGYNSDIFGFGLAISRKYPKLWKKLEPNWDFEFRRLKVKLKVTAHIRRTGLIMKPLTTK
jgi:spore germination protein KC